MASQIILRFTGAFAPENRISARTLAHTLLYLQRSIDKVVIYEKYGSLRKYSQLPNDEYALADLIVLPFEQGSIKIPLLNNAIKNLGGRLRGFLEEPYQQAAAEISETDSSLLGQVAAAYNRSQKRNPDKYNHQYLIDHPEVSENEYAQYAVVNDINHLLSPLRSSAITEAETISMHIKDKERSGSYEFDKNISTHFNRIIKSRKLGPEVVYLGKLAGLEKTRRGGFPYAGKFVSDDTGKEMRLWVSNETDALALNPYNLSSESFAFWGSPISQFGTFDPIRGDIVFLSFRQ